MSLARHSGPSSMDQTPPQPSPLDQLPDISGPANRALTLAGYSSLRDLVDAPRSDLLRLHGVGPKALRILDEELGRHGLGLAPAR